MLPLRRKTHQKQVKDQIIAVGLVGVILFFTGIDLI